MKRLCCLLFTAGMLCGLSGRAMAQPAEIPFAKDEDIPDFFYDVVTTASDDSNKTVLDVYTKITYDELQFLKDSTAYRAKYELSATVFDHKGEQTDGRIVEKEIAVKTYAETNSRKDFSTAEIRFQVPPGNYDLLLGIMDFDSKKAGHRKNKIVVPKYGGSGLSLSDIFVIDQIRSDSLGKAVYMPNVVGNYSEKQDSLYFLFHVYNCDAGIPARIQWSVLDMAGKTIRKEQAQRALSSTENTVVLALPKGDLRSGRYRLSLSVENGKRQAKKTKDISIHWAGMPAFASDLDHAIEQLRYIAKGGEIKKMKKAKGDEKQNLFTAFWQSMDPSPGTEENELMDEYYRRVDFTNANFTAFQQGWQTDRGMVYIILGPPNDIERHPFESGSKPYEIWTYYRLNRDFIFVDATGFGDYRLVSPFWDLVEHIR